MKIAQVVPPWLPVPPIGYGGTERVVDLLTRGLVARGHEVTLFATNDSYKENPKSQIPNPKQIQNPKSKIQNWKIREVDLGGKHRLRIVSVFEKHLGNDGELKKNPLLHLLAVAPAFVHDWGFDIIHNHSQYSGLFFAGMLYKNLAFGKNLDSCGIRTNRTDKTDKTKVIHTWHGTVDQRVIGEDKVLTLRMFKHQNFVSISNAQRLDMPELNWVGTVYNAVDLGEFEYRSGKLETGSWKLDSEVENGRGDGEYLAWLGRITPNKGVETAIEAAKRSGLQLRLAAFIDPIDKEYFEQKIKPKIDGRRVVLMGELDKNERSKFLGGALAFLFPIEWNEPFGLVMIEAMSCGTPVIAFDRGSVAEVVKDGETGYIINPKSQIPNPKQIQNPKPKTNPKHKIQNPKQIPSTKFQIQKNGIEGMVEAVKKVETQCTASLRAKIKNQMRINCRQWVEEKFTKEKMVEGYERIYKNLAAPEP